MGPIAASMKETPVTRQLNMMFGFLPLNVLVAWQRQVAVPS